jgi:RimJ/RimL family protein N-acetyltransferase
MHEGPAYRIETERLLLRCFEPRDAPEIARATAANVSHLRPWLEWARDEPESFEAKLALARKFRAQFDLGRDFTWGLFDPEEKRLLGAVNLHPTDEEAVAELGYWLDAELTGRGFATEASAAVLHVAFEVHLFERVEIHCDADNQKSARVAERLGFALDATLRRRKARSRAERVDRMVWSRFADEHAATSPSARFLALDALGRVLLDTRVDPPPRRGSALR